jgi:hypothetical protein
VAKAYSESARMFGVYFHSPPFLPRASANPPVPQVDHWRAEGNPGRRLGAAYSASVTSVPRIGKINGVVADFFALLLSARREAGRMYPYRVDIPVRWPALGG